MSANVQSMMYAGETPWHGLGVAVQGLQTAAQAIVAAGLNWKVIKKVLRFKRGGKVIEVPNSYAVIRTDNNAVLGVVGRVYRPMPNKEVFAFMDSVIGECGAVYETAGALGNGEKVWMLARIKGVMEARNGDDVDKFLLVSNSHDGTSKVTVALTAVRVVCQNTLTLAIKTAEQIAKVKHTKTMGSRVSEVRDALGLVNSQYAKFEKDIQAMAKIKFTSTKFTEYLKKVGFDVDAAEGRGKTQMDELTRLFHNGKGNNGSSLWDGLNAITEYVDWTRTTRLTDSFKSQQEARLSSQWFGSGLALKTKALEVAVGLVA